MHLSLSEGTSLTPEVGTYYFKLVPEFLKICDRILKTRSAVDCVLSQNRQNFEGEDGRRDSRYRFDMIAVVSSWRQVCNFCLRPCLCLHYQELWAYSHAGFPLCFHSRKLMENPCS